MLQYKNFHDDPTKPPFPWDPEAARWCRSYRKTHPRVFPVDSRELMRPERVKLNLGAPRRNNKPHVRLLSPTRQAASRPKSSSSARTTSKSKGATAKSKLRSKVRIK
jgi:hypothetical protein